MMDSAARTRSAAGGARVALLLGGLGALGPFSIDTYFPSFDAVGRRFGVGLEDVQLTLSLYLVAMAVMTLVHGPLSDAFGRRRVVVTALLVYVATAIACAVAPTFAWLLAARTAQGIVAGAGMIVGRALVRDLFEGARAQQIMAQVTMVFGLAPAAAPMLGGYLHAGFGWRASFWFLAALGSLLVAACLLWLPETLPPALRRPLQPAPLARAYLRVASDPAFLALALCLALGFGGFLVYVASAADFVPNVLGLGATEYGFLFVPIVAGLVAGSAAASRLSATVAPAVLVRAGLALMAAAAAANVLLARASLPALPWLVLALPPYTFGLSLMAPAVTIYALDRYPQRRGLAASVQSFVQTLSFALVASLLTPRLAGAETAYALAMALVVAASIACWMAFHRLVATIPASRRR